MRRRTALALGGMLLAQPLLGLAQPMRKFRIGWLSSTETPKHHIDAFVAGMRERGFLLGQHFSLDLQTAKGDKKLYPVLAAKLVDARPDVLIGVETMAKELRGHTKSIPIVLLTSIDPVAAGLVESFARPGTNVTGMADQFDELIAKQVELLAELVPQSRHIALLNDPNWSARDSYERIAREAAKAKGLKLTVIEIRGAQEIAPTLEALKKAGAEGVLVAASGGVLLVARQEIIAKARQVRLPVAYALQIYPLEGGLLSYGPDLTDNAREAAAFVADIVRGAKPSETPIRRISRFYLVVNAKAANSIGITVPQAVLLRADRVIE